MIKCDNCGDTSPYDAKFCIGCGKLIPDATIANMGATTRLSNTVDIDGKTVGPYIPYANRIEYGTGYQKPGINASGAPYVNPFVDYSDRDTNEPLYFIYKADLGALLKDESTYVKQTKKGYDIYYHGRKVVFMD